MVDHSMEVVVDASHCKVLGIRHRDLDLDSLAGVQIVTEPHKGQMQEWRHLREDRLSDRIAETRTARTTVLVVAAHLLRLEHRI